MHFALLLQLVKCSFLSMECGLTHIQRFYSLPVSQCLPDQFMCATGECIAAEQECDGVTNCEDGSDEGQQCCKLEK